METIPNEILGTIFGNLDVKSLKSASLVSTEWNKIISEESSSRKIWKLVLGEEQPEIFGTPRNAAFEDELTQNQRKKHAAQQSEKFKIIMASSRKFSEIFIGFSDSPSFNVSSPQISAILNKNMQTMTKFNLYVTNEATLNFFSVLQSCQQLSDVSIDHLDSIKGNHSSVVVQTLLGLKTLKTLSLYAFKIPASIFMNMGSNHSIEKLAISGANSHQDSWISLCSVLKALTKLTINSERGRYRGNLITLFTQLNKSCPLLKTLEISLSGALPKFKLHNLTELTIMEHDHNLAISDFLAENPNVKTVKFSRHFDATTKRIIEDTIRSSLVQHIHCTSGLIPPTKMLISIAKIDRPHLLSFTYATGINGNFIKTFAKPELTKIQNFGLQLDVITDKIHNLVHDN